ncbi:MAG: acyltransferase family protein [Bacteroidetes bacterium]|nr:acyltransferase family protein [Bacteroidota bacterium]
MKTRIYFLDNLRTFLILLVVVLHSGLVYESVLESIWIVIDPVKSNSIGLIRMYLDLFVMFSIFFISGYFISFSLKSKTAWGFVKSKFKRILLPWVIAVFTLIPAYKFIFLFSRGLPQEEWYSYFHFFERAGTDLSFFANNPSQNWLWFLPVLFIFQILYLGLSKTKLLSFGISLKTGVTLTFVIGVIYSMVISNLNLRGWFHSGLLDFQTERLLIYFMSFLLGSLCNKLNVFESPKNRKHYTIANVVLSVSMGAFAAVALNFFFNIIDPARNYFYISEFVDRVFYYISALLVMFSFLYVFIHVFRFSLNKTNHLMSQINRSSYSVYIMHVVVMGVIAIVLLRLQVPSMLKFLILTITTFALSNMNIYSYQKTIQKTINLKTIATMVIVFLILGTAFYSNPTSATNEINETSETQVNESEFSIHEAVIKGNLEAVKQYIKAGKELDVKEKMGGSSALTTAAVFGKTEIAIALIEAGADVNIKNNEGSTPLHTAAFFCRTEIVKALLAKGADKNLKNNAGSTALESVLAPYEAVVGIYDYFGKTFGSMGLKLDKEQIRKPRPVIAGILQNNI